MSEAGLILIVLGWIIQFFSKGKNIDMKFVIVYCLGVILLAIDGFNSNLTTLAMLNTASFVVAIAVFLKVRK